MLLFTKPCAVYRSPEPSIRNPLNLEKRKLYLNGQNDMHFTLLLLNRLSELFFSRRSYVHAEKLDSSAVFQLTENLYVLDITAAFSGPLPTDGRYIIICRNKRSRILDISHLH